MGVGGENNCYPLPSRRHKREGEDLWSVSSPVIAPPLTSQKWARRTKNNNRGYSAVKRVIAPSFFLKPFTVAV